MARLKALFSHKFFTVFKWVFLVLLALYLIVVGFRTLHFLNVDKTNAEVERIHSTKLQLSDVMGDNLPPDPGAEADATVEGVDANENGIRDDVELAIFEEYPDSARTRAVLLQYALALQMEFTQPVVNEEVVIAVAQEGGRAYLCVGANLERDYDNEQIMEQFFKEADQLREFVDSRQINTQERDQAQKEFYEHIGSYNSLDRYCDIDYSTLPN